MNIGMILLTWLMIFVVVIAGLIRSGVLHVEVSREDEFEDKFEDEEDREDGKKK